jgi:hypothetical protein
MLYMEIEIGHPDIIRVSSTPLDGDWDEIDKNSFTIPVPPRYSSEAVFNVVRNVLTNGGAQITS